MDIFKKCYEKGLADEIIEKGEYKNYAHCIMVCHMRLNYSDCEKFKDIYAEWLKRINIINPEAILAGHEHDYFIQPAGTTFFDTGLKFNAPTIVGAMCTGNHYTDHADENPDFIGTFIEISNNGIRSIFTNSEGEIILEK